MSEKEYVVFESVKPGSEHIVTPGVKYEIDYIDDEGNIHGVAGNNGKPFTVVLKND